MSCIVISSCEVWLPSTPPDPVWIPLIWHTGLTSESEGGHEYNGTDSPCLQRLAMRVLNLASLHTLHSVASLALGLETSAQMALQQTSHLSLWCIFTLGALLDTRGIQLPRHDPQRLQVCSQKS